MPWYKAGTVKTTVGSNAIVGTSTAFIANSRVGDAFRGPDGAWYEVTNIASDTAMSIAPVYQGVTVAAGSYALAPMQGYVKASADALNSLVTQFGETLANLGPLASATIAPVVNGGTGGNTQVTARVGLGLGAAAVASILGTVSQFGGVPTGAIFETGTNANGTYIKYADGNMVCQRRVSVSVALTSTAGKNYYSIAVAQGMPATFIAVPSVSVFLDDTVGASWVGNSNSGAGLNSWGSFVIFAGSGPIPARNYLVSYLAVGRWY